MVYLTNKHCRAALSKQNIGHEQSEDVGIALNRMLCKMVHVDKELDTRAVG